jgi:hypothetical protein
LKPASEKTFSFWTGKYGFYEFRGIGVALIDVGASNWALKLGWDGLLLSCSAFFFAEFSFGVIVVIQIEITSARLANNVLEYMDFRCPRAADVSRYSPQLWGTLHFVQEICNLRVVRLFNNRIIIEVFCQDLLMNILDATFIKRVLDSRASHVVNCDGLEIITIFGHSSFFIFHVNWKLGSTVFGRGVVAYFGLDIAWG